MTVYEFAHFFEQRVPRSLSCAWDNDGLLCCPDPDRQVRRILAALDVTEETTAAAVLGEYDLVLTHHPLIFRPIKALTTDACVPRKLLHLASAGISAIALHTRLDALDGGVNDALAAELGLNPVGSFPCEDALNGRIVELSEAVSAEEFAALVKARLDIDRLNFADAGKPVRRIGLVGGEGGDFIHAARAAGCDTYLTGRAGYHAMLDAREEGINVAEVGHGASERPVCQVLRALCLEADPTVRVDLFALPALKLL